jgi:hypothetical protein
MEHFRSSFYSDVKDLSSLTFLEHQKSLTKAISWAVKCDNWLFDHWCQRQQQFTRSRFTPTYASVAIHWGLTPCLPNWSCDEAICFQWRCYPLQGIGQFVARFAVKFDLQKFKQSRGKFAANDILVYREILPQLCCDLSACLSRPTEILPRLLPRLCRNNLAHFVATFSGNIIAKFCRIFTAYILRIYCVITVYLPRIYCVFTAKLPRIWRIFVAYLPRSYR